MTADATDRSPVRRSRLGLLLPLVAVVWLVAVPLLAFVAFGHSFVIEGQVRPDELRATERGLQLCAAAALGLSALGLVLSVRVRSVAGGIVFALLLLLSLGVAGFSALYTHQLHRDDPVPDPYGSRSAACQEHSGGDTRCPGG